MGLTINLFTLMDNDMVNEGTENLAAQTVNRYCALYRSRPAADVASVLRVFTE